MTEQTLLIKNADFLCTMAMPYSHEVAAQTEIKGGGLFAKNGIIEAVGTSDMLPDSAEIVLDLTGHTVIPGMVNTHHHLFPEFDTCCSACTTRRYLDGFRPYIYLATYWP